MMTEEEAKTKWYPFARVIPAMLSGKSMVVTQGVPAHNRVHNEGDKEATWHATMNCIGSACMSWRWDVSPFQAECDPHPTAGRALGHCGLAGKP